MKLLFVSLGCDKNLVDSEEMLGLLTGNGFEIVDDETEAEAIVVNTCCFINDAKEESVNTILEMAEYKKAGSCKVLIVMSLTWSADFLTIILCFSIYRKGTLFPSNPNTLFMNSFRLQQVKERVR